MMQITQALHNLLILVEVVGGFALGLFVYWHGISFAMEMSKRFKRRH